MTDIKALSEKYQTLRNGDNHDELESVMKELGSKLGEKGTPASELFESMGKPDGIVSEPGQQVPTIQTMPGPIIQGKTETTNTERPQYLVYNSKGGKLYFKVDPVSEKVQSSEWSQ